MSGQDDRETLGKLAEIRMMQVGDGVANPTEGDWRRQYDGVLARELERLRERVEDIDKLTQLHEKGGEATDAGAGERAPVAPGPSAGQDAAGGPGPDAWTGVASPGKEAEPFGGFTSEEEFPPPTVEEILADARKPMDWRRNEAGEPAPSPEDGERLAQWCDEEADMYDRHVADDEDANRFRAFARLRRAAPPAERGEPVAWAEQRIARWFYVEEHTIARDRQEASWNAADDMLRDVYIRRARRLIADCALPDPEALVERCARFAYEAYHHDGGPMWDAWEHMSEVERWSWLASARKALGLLPADEGEE